MRAVILYPHQLFENNILLDTIDKKTDVVYLIEDPLYFTQFKFHKQKLILHRASMQYYHDFLVKDTYNVKYIPFNESLSDNLKDIKKVFFYQFIDNWLDTKVKKVLVENGVVFEEFRSPMFINSTEENLQFFSKKDGTNRKPFMKTFYEWQRNRLDILMLSPQKPLGEKYSFDEENRKKLPKGFTEPMNINFIDLYKENKYILEAKEYVEKYFSENYGSVDTFNYAFNSTDAKKVLDSFLYEKLKNFGIYEDSISEKHKTINHSVLTPYLNIGLITPQFVVSETLKFVQQNPGKIPLNSLEGFLRQIIGWREFMRAMYEIYGTKMRNSNFFGHHKNIPDGWWTGQTGILPVDNSIKNVLETGYNHHIERLMVLGNFMLLNEYDPNKIYEWFMTLYIDSYDWVMVPNVYGMSQFADGGIFATKPYISASNYIFKMSDYKKSQSTQWSNTWDTLFWDFLKKHKEFFSKNVRFKMLLSRITE